MKFNNHVPIYLQIIDLIKKDIILGSKVPGEKLPSVRELAIEMKVNPNTVQKTYQEMERKELAFSKRGIGTFIIDRKSLVPELMAEMSTSIIDDFISKMHDIGYSNDEIIKQIEDSVKQGDKK